jgi:hypothetical protein
LVRSNTALHDARRRFLGVDLGHAPIIEEFSAAHGVAKVHHPIVARIDVAQRGRHSAFGHHRVRFAEQTLGQHAGGKTQPAAFDRRAKPGSAGSDHDDVVLDRLHFGNFHGPTSSANDCA